MRCPVHVSREMIPMANAVVVRKRRKGAALNDPKEDTRNIMLLRCPVDNCKRVDYLVVGVTRERPCPKCGEPSDAPFERRTMGDNVCRACKKAYAKSYRARRKALAA